MSGNSSKAPDIELKSAELKWQVVWLATPEQLSAALPALKSQSCLTLDTETVGWQTGNERLCLIQFGLPEDKSVLVIDALALGDLDPLKELLENPDLPLIAHNAAFEERQFNRHGIKLGGVIDTLELARKLRPELPNHTLQTCCKFILGIELSKDEQSSDWAHRPLSDAQLRYACLDAEVTYSVYDELNKLRERLAIDPEWDVETMMRELWGSVRERLVLTHGISTQLAFLAARETLLRETIRAKLIAGAAPYQGELGHCEVSKVKRTEINPEKVREVMPEIAELVVSEYVEKKRLVAVMEEHGINPKLVEKVQEIIGYNDRLSIGLKNV